MNLSLYIVLLLLLFRILVRLAGVGEKSSSQVGCLPLLSPRFVAGQLLPLPLISAESLDIGPSVNKQKLVD